MFELIHKGDVLITRIKIEKFDMSRAADFQESFSKIVDQTSDFVLLDMQDVAFMDSSGLAALVYCFQMTEIGAQMALCQVQERVMQLLRLTRLSERVRIFSTIEDAIQALQ